MVRRLVSSPSGRPFKLTHYPIVGSVHLHAGGLYDRTVSFEVLMDASFEFVEGRDVGLARAGLRELVREILALEDRTHLFAQLVDDILGRAGGANSPCQIAAS